MQIKEIMTPHVEIISRDTTIHQAAQKMRDLGVGVLPVGKNNNVEGIVTDRDITIRGVAEGLTPETAISRVMSPNVYFCYDDQNLEDVARLMEEKKVRRVLVYNRDSQLVGIASVGDLAVQGSMQTAEEVLEKVSEAPANR